MSFYEKSAWVLIVALALVGGNYIFELVEAGGIAEPGQILSSIIVFVILVTIFHIVIAVMNPKATDTQDERDREIERKGEVAGSYTLGGFMLAILAFSAIGEQWHIANLAFIGLLSSELMKCIWQVALYRLSA